MRNPRSWRRSIDISLDYRQVFFLFFVCAVLLAMAFALGVIIGKRTARAAYGDSLDPVAWADTLGPLGARDAVLAFHRAKQKKAAPVSVAGAAHVMLLKKTSTKSPSQTGSFATTVTPPLVDPLRTTSTETKNTTVTETSAIHASSPTPTAKPETSMPYSVQVSAFQDLKEAEQFIEKLKGHGVTSRMIRSTIPGRGVWYRIRIGNFATIEEANAVKADLETKHDLLGYVTRE